MTNSNANKTDAFTLVEMMIVVVILAILAVIIIPRLASADDTARHSTILSQLKTVRSVLDMYKNQHNDKYPSVAQMWDNLALTTNAQGDTSGTTLGPYLREIPVNPFTGGSGVAADNSADWMYDHATGTIQAVVPSTKIVKFNLSPSDAVAAP